jgi:Ring finger domain
MPYAKQSEILPDNNGSEKLCPICSETLKDQTKAVFKLDCGHFYHNDCLNDYCPYVQYNPRCPMCRAPFDPYDCLTFDTFKSGHLKVNSLPQEVQTIYYTLHPHLAEEYEGGKRRRNKSKRHNKKGKRVKRKTIRRK